MITFISCVLFPLQLSTVMLWSRSLPFGQSSGLAAARSFVGACMGIDSAHHPQCNLLSLFLQEFHSSLTEFVEMEKGRGHGGWFSSRTFIVSREKSAVSPGCVTWTGVRWAQRCCEWRGGKASSPGTEQPGGLMHSYRGFVLSLIPSRW